MGLSERKVKQRIGHDPRNLTWSDDKDRFSYKHMSSFGWSDNSGIGGSDLSGNPNHIVVARKLDNSGIGMGRAKKEGDELASGAGAAGQGLDDVLRRLAEAAARSGTSTPVETVVEVKTEVAPVRNRIASRQKHLHSKRLASQSPAALAEILGVSVASLSPSPAPVEITETTETKSGSNTPQDGRTADETVSTSTLSVSDYFRQKLREKQLARQGGSGSSTPGEMPEGSLARVKEEVKVAVGGVEWEGSRVTFSEINDDVKPDTSNVKPHLDVKPVLEDIKPVLPIESKEEVSKEERRRLKDEKRKRKEEKRAVKEEKRASKDTDVLPDKKSKRKREDESEKPKKSKKEKA